MSVGAFSASLTSLDSTYSLTDGHQNEEPLEDDVQTSEHFVSWPYGFQLKATHELDKKATNIMGGKYIHN